MTTPDLWTEATRDVEAEKDQRRVAYVTQAASEVWPFLAAAQSPQEYAARKAMAADRIEAAVETVAERGTGAFERLHAALSSSLDADFETLHNSPERVAVRRAAEAQRASQLIGAELMRTATVNGQACPTCGSTATTYSRAAIFDGHTSKCVNGHTFDQKSVNAPGEKSSKTSAEMKTAITLGDMEARAYDATCPNKSCKNHGISFVHDDLAGDNDHDDETANCPDCDTPLTWGGTAPRYKASQAKTAGEYGGGSPKSGDKATCHKDDLPIQFFDGQWMHLSGGPSHNDVYPATPKERAEKGKTAANTYVCMWRNKRADIQAETTYEAQKKAAEQFGAKKTFEVDVMLAQKDGKDVVHDPARLGALIDAVTDEDIDAVLSGKVGRGRNDFSLSDAKNEAGEWTMSPEQIRAEQNASDQDDYDDEDDYRGRRGSRHPFGLDDGLFVFAVAWGRRHYEDLAEFIATQDDRDQLAKHFGAHLEGTGPNYRRDQFEKAASTKGYRVRGGSGAANYSTGHFRHIADGIKSYPGNKGQMAQAFADHLSATNPRFNRDQFLKATAGAAGPMDRSLAFTVLLDVDPSFGKMDDKEGGQKIGDFLNAWHASDSKNMYEFGKQWVSQQKTSARDIHDLRRDVGDAMKRYLHPDYHADGQAALDRTHDAVLDHLADMYGWTIEDAQSAKEHHDKIADAVAAHVYETHPFTEHAPPRHHAVTAAKGTCGVCNGGLHTEHVNDVSDIGDFSGDFWRHDEPERDLHHSAQPHNIQHEASDAYEGEHMMRCPKCGTTWRGNDGDVHTCGTKMVRRDAALVQRNRDGSQGHSINVLSSKDSDGSNEMHLPVCLSCKWQGGLHDNYSDALAEASDHRNSKTSARHTAEEHGGYHLEEGDGGWYVVNHIGERKNSEPKSHDEALKYQRALMVNVPGAKEDAERHEKNSMLHPDKESGEHISAFALASGDWADWGAQFTVLAVNEAQVREAAYTPHRWVDQDGQSVCMVCGMPEDEAIPHDGPMVSCPGLGGHALCKGCGREMDSHGYADVCDRCAAAGISSRSHLTRSADGPARPAGDSRHFHLIQPSGGKWHIYRVPRSQVGQGKSRNKVKVSTHDTHEDAVRALNTLKGKTASTKEVPTTQASMRKHLYDEHKKDVNGWSLPEARLFHSNLHRYGGGQYDSSEGGVLTHDHPGLTTRKERNITGVNQNGQGADRYQNTPTPARPAWVTHWSDDDTGLTDAEHNQGRAMSPGSNPMPSQTERPTDSEWVYQPVASKIGWLDFHAAQQMLGQLDGHPVALTYDDDYGITTTAGTLAYAGRAVTVTSANGKAVTVPVHHVLNVTATGYGDARDPSEGRGREPGVMDYLMHGNFPSGSMATRHTANPYSPNLNPYTTDGPGHPDQGGDPGDAGDGLDSGGGQPGGGGSDPVTTRPRVKPSTDYAGGGGGGPGGGAGEPSGFAMQQTPSTSTDNLHAPNTSAPWRAAASLREVEDWYASPARRKVAAKAKAIADDIQSSNPGMGRGQALGFAVQTIRAFPRTVGGIAPSALGGVLDRYLTELSQA